MRTFTFGLIVCLAGCDAGTLPEATGNDAADGADATSNDGASGADSSRSDATWGSDAPQGDVATTWDSSRDEGPEGGDGADGREAGYDAALTPETGADAGMDGTVMSDAGSSDAHPQWSPASLPGLVLWLDGHVGLGTGTVGDAGTGLVWQDQSGQHNDALGVGSPTVAPTGLDGQPSVHLNGLTDYLRIQDSASLQWGSGDFTVAVVLQYSFADGGLWGYGAIYSKQVTGVVPFSGPAMFGYSFLSGQLDDYQGDILTTTVTGLDDAVPMLAVFQRTGDELSLSVNGTDVVTATGAQFAADASAAGYPALLGGTAAGQDLLGDIAEVVAVKGTTTSAALQELEDYLMVRYSLGVH